MSTRGHLNLTAADTFGVICAQDQNVIGPEIPHCGGTADSTDVPAPTNGKMATFNIDVDPFWDICSDASMGGTAALGDRPTIGNLLNDAGITWGWFQGGFALDPGDKCTSSHPLVSYDIASGVDPAQDPVRIIDYVPHHNPFQYFRSTANPSHLPPSSVDMIGQTDQANHLYDIPDLWKTADAGHLPSVIFIKPPGYQNGHPGYSDPLDAQTFIVETVNRLMQLPEWSDMAIFIAWDDSDGWYDHVMPPIINQSATNFDYLCGDESDGPGGRCGYGPRLPFIVVSPYAKENYVSNSLADQTSITRFIEDNWLKGRRLTKISFDNRANSLLDLFDFSKRRDDKLMLDPATGQPE
jgi:phospholipase C